jgi:hypothetical protein
MITALSDAPTRAPSMENTYHRACTSLLLWFAPATYQWLIKKVRSTSYTQSSRDSARRRSVRSVLGLREHKYEAYESPSHTVNPSIRKQSIFTITSSSAYHDTMSNNDQDQDYRVTDEQLVVYRHIVKTINEIYDLIDQMLRAGVSYENCQQYCDRLN